MPYTLKYANVSMYNGRVKDISSSSLLIALAEPVIVLLFIPIWFDTYRFAFADTSPVDVMLLEVILLLMTTSLIPINVPLVMTAVPSVIEPADKLPSTCTFCVKEASSFTIKRPFNERSSATIRV